MSEKPIIDVEELVEDLKRRVAQERAEGRYADVEELAAMPLDMPTWAGTGEQPAVGAFGTRIRFRPELAFSSKPVVGPVITGVKKVNVRMLRFVLDDLARQADAAVFRLESALDAEVAAREEAGAYAREAIEAETAVREMLQHTVQTLQQTVVALSERVDELETTLAALQLAPRLARLERDRRVEHVARTTAEAADGHPPASAPFDYFRFEDRYRPQQSVYERLAGYMDDLRGRTRVLDLGCGRGELLELLRDEGVSAYGVEIDSDFADVLAEKGLEVVVADAVAHLSSLEPGAVDGVVATHLVEHLPAGDLMRLVSLAADRLGDGGILILETPNPESLVAGSINFHRDPTHVRPIHPETLAFLCESEGLSDVEIRRLSPVPADERLPRLEGQDALTPLLDRLDELIYGFQDYAVVARKS